jgi:hypothetical protein
MSRTKYLKELERLNDAAKKTINDLIRENYELRTLLKEVQPHAANSADNSRS